MGGSIDLILNLFRILQFSKALTNLSSPLILTEATAPILQMSKGRSKETKRLV